MWRSLGTGRSRRTPPVDSAHIQPKLMGPSVDTDLSLSLMGLKLNLNGHTSQAVTPSCQVPRLVPVCTVGDRSRPTERDLPGDRTLHKLKVLSRGTGHWHAAR
jgi:hypothetical protein